MPAGPWASVAGPRPGPTTGRAWPARCSTSTSRPSTLTWTRRPGEAAGSPGRSAGWRSAPPRVRRSRRRLTIVAVWMRSVKLGFRGAVQPVAVALARAGIQANWLTYLGFILNVAVAVIVAQGWLGIGGAIFLIVNALDFLDGAVARAAGTAGAFGAFLDSVLDRYSEAVVFVGLIVYYSRADDMLAVIVTALALAGSFMVSYCRARAEGLGLNCEVGLLQRPERIVVLGIGLMLTEYTDPMVLVAVLIALALLTNVTAAQRMRHVARLFRERSARR